MDDFKWTKKEKKIARDAFDKAYDRECSDLAEKIRSEANNLNKP